MFLWPNKVHVYNYKVRKPWKLCAYLQGQPESCFFIVHAGHQQEVKCLLRYNMAVL